jgi:hypothetical protein
MTAKARDPKYRTTRKRGEETGFLFPFTLRLVMADNDPRRPRMSPPILIHSGQRAIPMIEPPLTANQPNVRVGFVVQELAHDAIAGGGVEHTIVIWETKSSVVTEEQQKGGPLPLSLPAPGETDTTWYKIYDAVLLGACGTFASFPVTHSARIGPNHGTGQFPEAELLGSFEGTDNNTLSSTGFYTLRYTIVAQDGARVSHFHFSGKVNVICSAVTSPTMA